MAHLMREKNEEQRDRKRKAVRQDCRIVEERAGRLSDHPEVVERQRKKQRRDFGPALRIPDGEEDIAKWVYDAGDRRRGKCDQKEQRVKYPGA